MRHTPHALLALAAVLSFGACNCNGGGEEGEPDATTPLPDGELPPEEIAGMVRLSVTPANATLTAEGSGRATQAYVATGHFDDDTTKDLSSVAVFSLDDPRLGSFSGSTFTSGTEIGGTTQVRARVNEFSGEATLTLVLKQTLVDDNPGSSGLPTNPGNNFGGTPTANRAPSLVYPNDGVMVPPNLGRLEFHFRKGHASNTLFELAFKNSITDVRIYLRCYLPAGLTPVGVTDGCIYTPTPAVWAWLSETNRGVDPLQVRVRATDDSGAGPVGESAPVAVQIARSELKGALYYWTTTGSTGIMRYDFAGPNDAVAEKVLGASGTGCFGCHALSRDGKKIATSKNGQHNGNVLLYDLSANAPKVPFDSTPKSNFFAWNPDGTRYAGVYGDNGSQDFGVMIFDGNTGQKLASVPNTGTSTNPASHPDWSPDGKHLLWTRMGQKGTNQRFHKGSILAAEVLANGTYGAPVTIVPEGPNGRNRYYPAVAPDSRFLAFNESTCTGSQTHCNADSDPTASLWAARLVENAPRVRLARADAPGILDGATTALTNSYPKWSPFEVRGSDGPTSRLNWLTFSSSRRYGLRSAPPLSSGENDSATLLWMAAVDPDVVEADKDGSYPAFALPFQDLNTSNHIAQWAQFAVVDGCVTDGDGCSTGAGGSACCNGLTCRSISTDPPLPCEVAGNCVCRVIETCGLTGDSCSSQNPCCGSLSCQNPTGGACSGPDCLCQPACGAIGQACGAGKGACCGGLLCLTPQGGGCSGDDCACRPGID